MANIPKYIEKLLQRREKLASDLLGVCHKIDQYCIKIGVDMDDPEAFLLTDIRIYCEPWNAINNTRDAIKKALERRDHGNL